MCIPDSEWDITSPVSPAPETPSPEVGITIPRADLPALVRAIGRITGAPLHTYDRITHALLAAAKEQSK